MKVENRSVTKASSMRKQNILKLSTNSYSLDECLKKKDRPRSNHERTRKSETIGSHGKIQIPQSNATARPYGQTWNSASLRDRRRPAIQKCRVSTVSGHSRCKTLFSALLDTHPQMERPKTSYKLSKIK
ncbi:unnamed protein product [Trichogramma brassicae]|uniref:Uncharacterized protein n=1 Tax=Trichogramma brassicae TaxID=86971 RepID=A0A6H5IU81_9HYME|nr:unnamed protein product [Trichogramma brassicae]